MPKTAVSAEGEALPKAIHRRSALAALATVASCSAAIAPGVAGTSLLDTAFFADLHEWRAAYDASATEEECGPLWDAKCSIADRIMTRPAHTAIGLGVKLLVLTEYGEHDLSCEYLDAVLNDAKRIIGVPMPTQMAAWYASNGERRTHSGFVVNDLECVR